ncbi:GPI mannosyltransferase 2 isoform X2 [Prunus yedoensis var. nudiflora]|uniref:GPI mannosyltransferase 2 n=1 Tax=Prunus yedoensis var. nudiflora TaxID=2094558 RepID=A0A314Z7V0_PRUYE|nr:GPI mannosyltransferase 2 isoform X2 [Prunus yedoensis var. nudiflora]
MADPLEPLRHLRPHQPNCLSNNSSQPNVDLQQQHVLLPSLGSAIESSIVWDSVFFVRIAQCGYEYEQTYAFFPLLPLCISLLSRTVLAPLVPVIGQRAVLGLSGYVINNIAFVFVAVYLYRLSVVILKDHEAALRASILFCFNPASIFYSSIYSETLYALFSVGGLYHLISGKDVIAVLWFASLDFQGPMESSMLVVVGGALRCIFIFVPFVAFQAYGYNNICLGHLPNSMSPWCKARVPLLYNYIQSHYWGVGFLRYFQVKQLPNFLLASPILSLTLCSIVHYAKLKPEIFFSLGFCAPPERKDSAAVFFSLQKTLPTVGVLLLNGTENRNLKARKQVINDGTSLLPEEYKLSAKQGYLSAAVLPCILHLGFMAATAFFVMHVQVATRFFIFQPSSVLVCLVYNEISWYW